MNTKSTTNQQCGCKCLPHIHMSLCIKYVLTTLPSCPIALQRVRTRKSSIGVHQWPVAGDRRATNCTVSLWPMHCGGPIDDFLNRAHMSVPDNWPFFLFLCFDASVTISFFPSCCTHSRQTGYGFIRKIQNGTHSLWYFVSRPMEHNRALEHLAFEK